ncbi:hypothetical protein roselon_02713 [Roseibacterium elongatum DSM 19469]|uniref:Uncharacterized protein n=1 Tax=Roseicyclus elongatus DSM 19469 TaxID=1294273 RepID=W8S4A0_9RHOB|nr:hypothetical protein [Roseibacterium elongatum]AHM05012.1 hypothetical protein roselon_02713 [Roseibacterium elongatum DSM 19469]
MPTRPIDPYDPKGLVFEAFRIEGITDDECRSILVDWALSVTAADMRDPIAALIARHAEAPADHPMHKVLAEGLEHPPMPRRRGGRRARLADS